MPIVLNPYGEWIEEYSKVIESHAIFVAESAWAQLEEDMPLMKEVCDKGKKCREEVEIEYEKKVRSEWEKVVENLYASIVSATEQTKEILEQGWTKKVQCEIDKPCCTYGIEW